MPRLGNFQDCKIYMITSMNQPELVYYGHTTQKLSNRFSQHKAPSNDCTSKQIIDLGDAIIVLVEEYPCDNIMQASAREAYYILNNDCVNKNIPLRTRKKWYLDNKITVNEKHKIYADSHKQEKKEYQKIYEEANKSKIAERKKLKYIEDKKKKLIQLNNGVQQINQEMVI